DSAGQADDDLVPGVADLHVGRPGDEDLGLGGAVIDRHQLELVGVGVLGDLADTADDDLVGRPDRAGLFGFGAEPFGDRHADAAHRGDLQPGERQALDELADADAAQVHVLTQPTQGYFHGVWVGWLSAPLRVVAKRFSRDAQRSGARTAAGSAGRW